MIPSTATSTDRALAAFRKLVASVFPSFLYALVHEYSVTASDGATFSGQPTDATFSPPLPQRVPYAPSLAGSFAVVPVGTLAHVAFVNADPSKPRCVGFDLPAVPSTATVDATGGVRVGPSSGATTGSPTTAQRFAREGDVYSLGMATGPLTFVSTTQISGPTTGKG